MTTTETTHFDVGGTTGSASCACATDYPQWVTDMAFDGYQPGTLWTCPQCKTTYIWSPGCRNEYHGFDWNRATNRRVYRVLKRYPSSLATKLMTQFDLSPRRQRTITRRCAKHGITL